MAARPNLRLLTWTDDERRLTREQWRRWENVGLAPELDLDALLLNWTDRRATDLKVKGALVGLTMERTIEGASTVSMTLRDPDRRLFSERRGRVREVDPRKRKGRQAYKRTPVEVDQNWNPLLPPDVFGRPMEVELDGVVFRLVGVRYSSATGEATLTFEDRLVYWLRRKRGAKRANRKRVTRAQFVLSLVREIGATNVRFVCPELNERQPTDKASGGAGARRQRGKPATNSADTGGIAPNARVLVYGRKATPEQRRIGTRVLRVADEEQAPRKARLALVEACLVESHMTNLTGGDASSSGVLQVLASTGHNVGVDPRDVEAVCREFLRNGYWRNRPRGAIELSKSTSWSAGKVAQECQGSAYPDRYDQVKADAETWLDAWGGGSGDSGGSSGPSYKTKAYQFARNSDENSWEAVQRLAAEVGWRCFIVGNSIYYMSEAQLYARRPRYQVRDDDPAVIELSYDVDWGKAVSEAQLVVALDRWGAPPGSVVQLAGFGPPDGRWLVSSVSRDWFSPTATVNLRQPGKAKLEPANERVARANVAGGSTQTEQDTGGTKAEQVYAAARAIHQKHYPYVWGGGHAAAGRPDGGTGRDPGIGYDCSGSVCAALAAAGLGYRTGGPVDVSGTMASSWGKPGRGRQLTVWANGGHVWMQFHGVGSARRFDTSSYGDTSGSGPRLRSTERPTSGFVARHWPGV